MKLLIKHCTLFVAPFLAMAILSVPNARAQQTLGGLTGTVTDPSGAVIAAATVTLVGDETKLTRSQTTNSTGTYLFVNIPIGSYTLTFTQPGFDTQVIPSILVQANRTATVNAELQVGNVSESITVEETPLLNSVDTTNGYVMDKLQIESVPLPTGSFTGLAILSPGVNAELPGGSGANSGLGNAPVWANGQRDTSNAYLMNGVNAYSLFNGKSTSQVASARVVNNTGIGSISAVSSIPVQSSSSVYLAIGESIPSPAPESISEVRVNTSMYDAQQGSNSGAHIDMSTASGTNNIHGSLYVHRGTNWLNADPYFYNADPNIPASEKNPGLHRYTAGGTIGLPIIKDKLFFFGSYQYTRASDDEIGISRAFVPLTLTDTNRASLAALADAANNDSAGFGGNVNTSPAAIGTAPGNINPIAYALLNYPGLNGQKYLIPSANPNAVVNNPGLYSSDPGVQYGLEEAFPEDAEVPGTAVFLAHQAVADLDWNPNSTHSFSAKYYYQHDPTTAPYAYSMVHGFDQHLDAGSQVISLSHTQIVKSNLSITEIFGFIREKAYSTISQPFSTTSFQQTALQMPAIQQAIQNHQITADDLLIHNLNPNSTLFPGISTVFEAPVFLSYPYSINIGAGAFSQGAFTGVFQNRFNPSANAIWSLGKHTISFGGSFDYSQLNTKDSRNLLGTINAFDFTNFVEGNIVDNFLYGTTSTITGNANRYWRANETGEFIQDKYQLRSNLTITAGLRFDWDGGLTEKNGDLLNFDPSRYGYNPMTDTLSGNGLIIAGNNSQYATPGVSKTTLTGRQWGFAPRVGVAWSPKKFDSKVVVRAGWGIYYDRGEVYAYLSPGLTQNITNGGPFGINQQEPFVHTQFCPTDVAGPSIPCNGNVPNNNQLAYPWGLSPGTQPTGNPATIIPTTNLAAGITDGAPPFYLGAYARNNKLPYTMNSSLDIQWQPRSDLAIDIGYVGGLGRHEVIPIPFNQARQASLDHPLCGTASVCQAPGSSPYAQTYTYGYTVNGLTLNGSPMLLNSEGGNVDLRVPYIGYGAESEIYTAEGISAYNALQTHVEKRLSHGLMVGASYTYSHSLDEQSALGLFYNGNNPLNIRDAYGPSDFDRTHVINIDYHYELPKFFATSSWEGKVADGWSIQGIVTVQSGQPYSVIDYSGAVGSSFYSVYDGITNPILPLKSTCTPQMAVTGATGNNIGAPALNANCFQIPLIAPNPGGNVVCPGTPANTPVNGVPCGDTFETSFTSGQRNIFRQSWQRRADVSITKVTQLSDRFSVKYSLEIFNLTNTPSFDIPIDNVTQNAILSPTPTLGTDPLPNTCPSPTNSSFYSCPTGLGQVTKTIGSSRQVQMSLGLTF